MIILNIGKPKCGQSDPRAESDPKRTLIQFMKQETHFQTAYTIIRNE